MTGRDTRADATVVLGVFVLVGVVGGLLWWLAVDPAELTRSARGAGMGEPELGKEFNADGWYVVIAAVGGLLTGAIVSWWRSRDELVTTILLTVGAGIAAVIMAVTGHLAGPGNAKNALADAAIGQHVPVTLHVTATAAYLVWPIAALVGALVVLWLLRPRGRSRQ